jgi:RNA recognition motif-containing protein
MENFMKKIFVGNLSWKTSEDELKAHFQEFGKVVSAKIVTDKQTGRSKGFGFVEMEREEDAKEAIAKKNGETLGDRPLRLSLAQERDRPPREPRSNDSYGSRSNYRSNQSRN